MRESAVDLSLPEFEFDPFLRSDISERTLYSTSSLEIMLCRERMGFVSPCTKTSLSSIPRYTHLPGFSVHFLNLSVPILRDCQHSPLFLQLKHGLNRVLARFPRFHLWTAASHRDPRIKAVKCEITDRRTNLQCSSRCGRGQASGQASYSAELRKGGHHVERFEDVACRYAE
jgi:hypothetical protein